MKNYQKNKSGFTLIELLVTMFMFAIVILVVLGLFSMSVNAQRKVLAQERVQEDARYLMEFIVKEIRMSIINASVNSSTINITRSDGEIIDYTFTGGNLERSGEPINSNHDTVTGSFFVTGIGGLDNLQPKVTISIRVQGEGIKSEEQSSMDLQTTLSQRKLDI